MDLPKLTREGAAGPIFWKGARWPREEVRRDILLFIATGVIMDITCLIGSSTPLVRCIQIVSVCGIDRKWTQIHSGRHCFKTQFSWFPVYISHTPNFRYEGFAAKRIV